MDLSLQFFKISSHHCWKFECQDSISNISKSIAQRPITQRQHIPRPSKHDAMADRLNNSVRSHAASPPDLAVAAIDPSEFRI